MRFASTAAGLRPVSDLIVLSLARACVGGADKLWKNCEEFLGSAGLHQAGRDFRGILKFCAKMLIFAITEL